MTSADLASHQGGHETPGSTRNRRAVAAAIVLLTIGGIIALVQAPPHAAFSITGTCCPKKVETETFVASWRIHLALALATMACCWLAAIALARKGIGIAALLATVATALGAVSISDQSLVIPVGDELSIAINALIFVGAGASLTILLYMRARNERRYPSPGS